jgi:hypothetical protein
MRPITLPLALLIFAGCGDPVLPSDYAGPPAAAVSGNVVGLTAIRPDVERPRMSLEWLVVGEAVTTGSLMGQALTFHRSDELQHDWDIGLRLPTENAKFNVPVDIGAGAGARIGVAKMVYFDDRNKIERIDWTCAGPTCNRVLAVSAQFVLFVEQPSYCQEPGKLVAREQMAAGYHYFSFNPSTRVMSELSSSESMAFNVVDKAPADSLLVGDLLDFTSQLWRNWHLGVRRDCD